MKKYLLLYHAPAEAAAKMANFTPERKAKETKAWMAWKDKLGDKIVNFGSHMMGAYRLNSDGTESYDRSEITGYSVIQADNPKEAESLIKSHPHLQ